MTKPERMEMKRLRNIEAKAIALLRALHFANEWGYEAEELEQALPSDILRLGVPRG